MKISIFNINKWLLPRPYSKNKKDRVQKLVQFINKNNPDIITLQEFPRIKYIKELQKQLSGYHFSHKEGRVINKSALLTLSKEKPLKMEFFPFKKQKSLTRVEKFITKAVLATHFKDYIVYNTHFYLVKKKKNLVLLDKQLEFVKTIIDKKKLSFLCGDLNMEKQHFDQVNKNFFSYAEDTKTTFAVENRYHRKWWDRKIHGDKKIDYVLIKNPVKRKLSYESETVMEDLSDHYGIYTKVVLN